MARFSLILNGKKVLGGGLKQVGGDDKTLFGCKSTIWTLASMDASSGHITFVDDEGIAITDFPV